MPAREPQFSSLGFPPYQPVRSSPQPIASAFGAYTFLQFPRVPVDAGYHLGCFREGWITLVLLWGKYCKGWGNYQGPPKNLWRGMEGVGNGERGKDRFCTRWNLSGLPGLGTRDRREVWKGLRVLSILLHEKGLRYLSFSNSFFTVSLKTWLCSMMEGLFGGEKVCDKGGRPVTSF